MNDLSDAFMNNNSPTTFVEPWGDNGAESLVRLAMTPFEVMLAGMERDLKALRAIPSGPAVAADAVEPLRVSPLTGFHPYRKENDHGE